MHDWDTYQLLQEPISCVTYCPNKLKINVHPNDHLGCLTLSVTKSLNGLWSPAQILPGSRHWPSPQRPNPPVTSPHLEGYRWQSWWEPHLWHATQHKPVQAKNGAFKKVIVQWGPGKPWTCHKPTWAGTCRIVRRSDAGADDAGLTGLFLEVALKTLLPCNRTQGMSFWLSCQIVPHAASEGSDTGWQHLNGHFGKTFTPERVTAMHLTRWHGRSQNLRQMVQVGPKQLLKGGHVHVYIWHISILLQPPSLWSQWILNIRLKLAIPLEVILLGS